MTVENSLPHGLKQSLLGSQYKTEYDENLVLLDKNRVTTGTLVARPTAGIAERFYFAVDTSELFYDNGTAWVSAGGGGAGGPHASTHASGGTDAISLAQSQVTNLVTDIASKANSSHAHIVSDVTDFATEVTAHADVSSNNAHRISTANPHSVTKADVALGNVDDLQQIPLSLKGVVNGVAELDATGKVPSTQLPGSIAGALSYQGVWDASLNSPAIPASSASNKGFYYKVSVAGSTLVDSEADWKVGDWIVSDGTVWSKIDNTESVSSVNGKTGVVSIVQSDITNLVTDISTKSDKVGTAVSGNFAGLDVNGNLTDSGSKSSDFAVTAHNHDASYAATTHAATHTAGGADEITVAQSQVTNLATDLTAKQSVSEKGAVNGYASLDATAIVPVAQLPVLDEDAMTSSSALHIATQQSIKAYVDANAGGGGGAGTGTDYILIQDQKTLGTGGGTFTSGAWRTRDLNTEVNDAGGHASISSNQVTLAAGTYRFSFSAPTYLVNKHQAKFKNITDTIEYMGTSESNFEGSVTNRSMGAGRFTIAGSKVFEVQHKCQTTVGTVGFGRAATYGTEIYAMLEFWKEL